MALALITHGRCERREDALPLLTGSRIHHAIDTSCTNKQLLWVVAGRAAGACGETRCLVAGFRVLASLYTVRPSRKRWNCVKSTVPQVDCWRCKIIAWWRWTKRQVDPPTNGKFQKADYVMGLPGASHGAVGRTAKLVHHTTLNQCYTKPRLEDNPT
eukprot:2351528-Amphidinium_carterae.2